MLTDVERCSVIAAIKVTIQSKMRADLEQWGCWFSVTTEAYRGELACRYSFIYRNYSDADERQQFAERFLLSGS